MSGQQTADEHDVSAGPARTRVPDGDTSPQGAPARASRRAVAIVAGVVLLLITVLASLRFGSVATDWPTVIRSLTMRDVVPGELTDQEIIVRDLRLPRTLLGVGVGVALALAGALMQAVTRNPLADPGILGVNAGAALAIIMAISFLGLSAPTSYVWFGLAGAAVAAMIVYGLGSGGRGTMTPVKVTLAGAVLAALLSSFTSAILLLDERSLDQFRFWMVGSIAGRDMSVVSAVAPFMLTGLILALAVAPAVNVLVLGDDVARSLGQRVVLIRVVVAAAVVLLAGSAVAAAGPIAFMGLAVPHIVRLVAGPDYRWILVYSLLYAPVLLLGADILGRYLISPNELEVGVATALVGAPLFVALARRRRLAAT
ncbi:FecCD family ABC transporter permease [Phytoactinopolyspora mesophila]|uniref:Iron chelate uptake ABC transporter family permease subunit n=1 Tax=Phytoactinopolyspora mesophila TaxID=2650750 RepID=A0A7K3M0N4_9ACTN|nr:iron chelate uptake ABC transporter family permease subunit [Phytoactinopolyspora mesophila]NDL56861.1 iron chelate uptake ABC transporter family permease subunit [Phytoactinopolyspora mesophila]